MLGWMVEKLMRRTWSAVNAGDVERVMRNIADDCCMTFPGTSSWSGEYRGKAQIEGFLRRALAHGLQFEVHDVLVKGLPWDLTVVTVISDCARDAEGRVQYANRAVEYYRVRWFKIRSCEVFEDTEKASAWDRVLGATAA